MKCMIIFLCINSKNFKNPITGGYILNDIFNKSNKINNLYQLIHLIFFGKNWKKKP